MDNKIIYLFRYGDGEGVGKALNLGVLFIALWLTIAQLKILDKKQTQTKQNPNYADGLLRSVLSWKSKL